jgi:hypothetical protein
VNDVEYKNMLEEFLIQTLEEEGSNDMLFQQDGTLLISHCSSGIRESKVSMEMEWQRLIYHLATSFP